MSNKGAQKKKATSQQQRGKPKDTSIDNISEATREKIEKIKTVTGWQVSEDIFNLLRDCNFNEAVTIDKIISGDAGHPGEQWQEVTRERKKKEPQPVEVQQPQADRSGREKQNRSRPGTGGARGGRANGQQPGGTKRTAYRQQPQGKRPVGDNRPVEPGPSAPLGVSATQQVGQHYPPQSRGPTSQRPQSNGNRRPPVGRGGPGSPKSQPQGQGHVHSQSAPHGGSQTPTQIQPNQPPQQVPLRETPSPVPQEHSHRESESAPRVEQARAPVEQLKIQQEEPLSHTQVPQQTQQAHSGQGQDRNSQQRAPMKKAPGKSQFVQANPPTSHTTKSHPPPSKGRRAENFVWQAKEASATSGQVSTNRSPQQNLRSSPEPQVARQPSPSQNLNSALSNDDLQFDKAAVILPSDLNAYESDDTDASLNLHFGNFGTAGAIPKEQFQRQTPSAVTRQPVGRPVASAPAKENKELPVTSAPQPTTVVQAQTRKQPGHPSEKKQAPQQPLRPAPAPAGMGMDSGLGDELNFPPPHMQMNPQAAFSSYNPGGHFFMPSGQYTMSDIDPSANPMTHHNYYDPSFPQGTSYRASSPHQGDVSSKYQTQQYREKYPPQQASQAASSPVQDRHDKHRQDSGSPPPRGAAQGHPQSPQSPPPGQHPSQPQPLPYSIPASQYPQIYGYPYQYSYPATSSQFTGFSRYPVHYPKHFPNMSATSSGGYPLSPPTSSEMLGYPDEVQMMAAADYINQNPDMSASGPYKQDYTGGELRGASASNYYKGYTGQPGHQHNPSQFGGQQGGQYVQQGGYSQGQFPFMHQPPHHLMQGQQQPQQQNSSQGQASFP